MAESKRKRGRPVGEYQKLRKHKRYINEHIDKLCDALSDMYEARFRAGTLDTIYDVTVRELDNIVKGILYKETMEMYTNTKSMICQYQLAGKEIPAEWQDMLDKLEEHLRNGESIGADLVEPMRTQEKKEIPVEWD